MSTYEVTWKMGIEADSPEDAARKARGTQLDPDAWVGFFAVEWREDGDTKFDTVDLDILDGKLV